MTKENLVKQLEAAKTLSSQVDIDKVVELIKQIETPTRFTQELADEIASKIERCLDHNCDDLVDKDNATFNIGYGNVIEIDDIQLDSYEVMRHIIEVIDDFVNEDEVESEQNEELTIPGFENGSGIDQVSIN
jgi:hypothetical protein